MISPSLTDLDQHDTIRLISSARLKDPVLLPLAANRGALRDLEDLESVTNGRLRAQLQGLADLKRDELVFGRFGHTFINAAFTHTRTGGNRFNDSNRGAWYCAFEVETSLGEVAYHLARELAAIGRYENTTDYAELFADFVGKFHDIRGGDGDEPALNPDPLIAYPAGQALARYLRSAGKSVGLVYPSVRHPGGTCLVAFEPTSVQNIRQGGLWRLEWQGKPKPTISRPTA
jgi:hypothetical protein